MPDGEQWTKDFAWMGGVWDQDNRVNPTQPLGPGSAQQLHQDRLGLIIQRVGGENRVGVALRDEGGEDFVSECARGLLDGLRLAGFAGAGDAFGYAGLVNVQRDFEAQANCLYEGQVRVRLVAAQPVMDVNGGQT